MPERKLSNYARSMCMTVESSYAVLVTFSEVNPPGTEVGLNGWATRTHPTVCVTM